MAIFATQRYSHAYFTNIARVRWCTLPPNRTWIGLFWGRKPLLIPTSPAHSGYWRARVSIGKHCPLTRKPLSVFCTFPLTRCTARYAPTTRRFTKPRPTRPTVLTPPAKPPATTWRGRITTPTACRCSLPIALTIMGRSIFLKNSSR